MTDFEQSARVAIGRLQRLGVSYALVGGFAVSVRAEPRFTRDLDLAVAVEDDEQAEAIVSAFVGDGHKVLGTVEQQATGRLATVRIRRQGGDDVVDLLFASSGIEREVTEGAARIEVLPGLELPVASVGHLIALKLLATDDRTRPQDRVDLRALVDVADADDLASAHTAVVLIEARGYHRSRDLVSALATLLADP